MYKCTYMYESKCKKMTNTENNYISNFENLLAPGNEPNMVKEYNPLVAFKLEKYLNPSQLKKHVLKSEKIKQLVDYYAQTQNVSTKEIKQQVHDILDEIGLDRNMAIIRWCGIAITAIGKRICKGIYVNKDSMDKVKQSLGKNPVLYLPSHRSYMDFILMSYICFHYDIEIPGIAAGMDFHSMFAMGTMLRKTGAFFMRRSFSNDELYWDVFREYIYALVASYHIGVEFFIEGTRSRNFKALVPKIGLLSMALLPFFTGEVSDITIVPVSVSYERVLEEQLFVYELLGVPKPKESTKGFFKALKIIDERFGKMYLDFGEPISVKGFMGEHFNIDRMKRSAVGVHLQKLNKKEIDLVKSLAAEIIYQQQRRIVITTFNLICLHYTSQYYNGKSVNLDQLSHDILLLKNMFEELGAHVATDRNCIKSEILETIEIHPNVLYFSQGYLEITQVPPDLLAQEIDLKRLKGHSLSPYTMAVAVPSMTLQLYINPCLFWLARPGYLILSAMQLQNEQTSLAISTHDESVAKINQRVNELDDIFKYEFIIKSNREEEEFKRNLTLLKGLCIVSISDLNGRVIVNHNKLSYVILSAIAPFLCVYYQLAVSLNNMFSTDSLKEIPIKDILKIMQQRIEAILNTTNTSHSLHVHPYCLALDNLNIAIQALVQESYLERNRETGNYIIKNPAKLVDLEKLLLGYCNLMPFKQYYYRNSLISKL